MTPEGPGPGGRGLDELATEAVIYFGRLRPAVRWEGDSLVLTARGREARGPNLVKACQALCEAVAAREKAAAATESVRDAVRRARGQGFRVVLTPTGVAVDAEDLVCVAGGKKE